MGTVFWLGAFVVLLLIEIVTLGLTTIWFAAGAIASFLAACIGCGTTVQIIVFFAVSVVLLILTRPIAVKFFNQKRESTNAESLIGQKATVVVAIPAGDVGRVIVNGMEWAAKTEDSDRIEFGSIVSIRGIQGVKLIVER